MPEEPPIHLSSEEGAVHTEHEALMGGQYFAVFLEPTGELRLTAQASGLLDISGNTKGGRIPVLLTSCLTGLD